MSMILESVAGAYPRVTPPCSSSTPRNACTFRFVADLIKRERVRRVPPEVLNPFLPVVPVHGDILRRGRLHETRGTD